MTFEYVFLQLTSLNPFDAEADIVGLDDQISGMVSIAIAIFSVTLAIIAYASFRKTDFSKLKFIICAFSLFTVYLIIDGMQEFLPINDDSVDLILSGILLLILICFFFGILKKQRQNHSSKYSV